MIRFVLTRWKRSRFWAVYDRAAAGWSSPLGSNVTGLVAVCVYKKGARALADRLNRRTA